MRHWAVLGLVVLCGCQPGQGLLTSSPPPEEHGEPLDCGLPEEPAAVEIDLPEEDTSADAPAQEAQGEPAPQPAPEPKPATKEYQDTGKGQNSRLPEGAIEKQSRRVAVSGRTFHAAAIKVQQDVMVCDLLAIVDDYSCWQEFIASGVDMLQSDFPHVLGPLVEEYNLTGVFPAAPPAR